MTEVLKALEDQVIRVQAELSSMREKIGKLLASEGTQPVPSPVADSPVVAAPKPQVAQVEERTQFDDLADLLKSEEWPHAISPTLICDTSSEQDKQDRAEGILDIIIDVHLEGLKFLDFGCGEGHVVAKAKAQNPATAMGYDIIESPRWREFGSDNVKFGKDWDEVVANGPYNVILLYDVIDHILNEEPVSVLRRLRPLLAPGGKVFVRCHPFCSRHATHLYHSLNKAYAHLVFSESELASLGYKTQHKTNKVIHPLMTYNDVFAKSGFTLAAQPQVQREPVEPFFVNNPLVAARIKANWADSHDQNLRSGTNFPLVQMEQQFLDYVLL